MITRTQALLTAISIALGASALSTQAAETGATLEHQLEATDGAPQSEPAQTPARRNHETPRQAATNAWFVRERAQPTVVVPYVAPKSDATLASQPATATDGQGE